MVKKTPYISANVHLECNFKMKMLKPDVTDKNICCAQEGWWLAHKGSAVEKKQIKVTKNK